MSAILPLAETQFVDKNGAPLAAGKVYFYVPGTTTFKDTYQDSSGTLNTNPVTLDAAGRAVIWGTGSYRQVVQDSLGNTIWDKVTNAYTSTSQPAFLLADLQALTGMADGFSQYVTGRTASGDGYEGFFAWSSADLSTEVTSDPQSGVYVPPSSDTTGASGAWVRQYYGALNILWFGAVPNGVTDSTAAIQAANDFAATLPSVGLQPCRVLIPSGSFICEGLVPSTSRAVSFVGVEAGVAGDVGLVSRLVTTTTTPIVNGPSGAVNGLSFNGVSFVGSTSAYADLIYMPNAVRMFVTNCGFNNCNSSIKILAGAACQITGNYAYNCNLGASGFASVNGAFHVLGNDHMIEKNEVSTSRTTVSNASFYSPSFYLGGAGHFISENVAEFGDVGYYLDCQGSRFSATRADHNAGHGFFLNNANLNIFVGCHSYDNSQAATNTYDGFYSPNNSSNYANLFDGCMAFSTGVANVHRYGFNDTNVYHGGTTVSPNRYSNCLSVGSASQPWNIPFPGAQASFPNAGNFYDITGSSTPDISQKTRIYTSSTTDSYSSFTNSVEGQAFTLLALASGATIVNGTNIKTASGANITLANNTTYSFVMRNGVAYQL